jgi:molybdenum cofactor synthesis domain-containing protein
VPHDSKLEGLPAFVLTVSDGVSAGTREDRSGDVLVERLGGLGFDVSRAVAADEPDDIARLVAEAADGGARLVVTTGGTGLGPRDRTPEGVSTIVDYVVPGFGEAMRAEGRTHTPLASLSRSLGAVRGQTLILCLPGSPKGVSESLDAVESILGHTLDTLAGRTAHT